MRASILLLENTAPTREAKHVLYISSIVAASGIVTLSA
jgi:hypothetical protein